MRKNFFLSFSFNILFRKFPAWIYLEQMFSFFAKLFYTMFTFYNFTILLLLLGLIFYITRAKILSICLLHLLQRTYNYAIFYTNNILHQVKSVSPKERNETRSLRYKLDSLHLQPPSREMETQRRERPICDTGIIEIPKSISLCINYRGVRGVSSSEMPLSVIALILSKCPSACDDSILI